MKATLTAPLLGSAIARRLHLIANQFDEPWDDFRDVPPQVQRLMAALLREIATAIDEESRR